MMTWDQEIRALGLDFGFNRRQMRQLEGIIRRTAAAHKGADNETLYNAAWRGFWDMLNDHLGAA